MGDRGRGRRADLAGRHRRHQLDWPRGREARAAQGPALPGGRPHRHRLPRAESPGVLATIFREAFSFKAAAGATAGIGIMVAMRYGLARGVYANEAGYGTAAVVFGTARSDRPGQQGLNAVMEVFVVSFVTSSISALTILVTGVWRSGQTSTAVVAQAFDTAIPGGGIIVALCAFLFGYTALIGWAYYGEQFLEYIFGVRVTLPYRWIYCILIVFGAVAQVDLRLGVG